MFFISGAQNVTFYPLLSMTRKKELPKPLYIQCSNFLTAIEYISSVTFWFVKVCDTPYKHVFCHGSLLKGIDNKTVKRQSFRRLSHLFTYVFFSLTHIFIMKQHGSQAAFLYRFIFQKIISEGNDICRTCLTKNVVFSS